MNSKGQWLPPFLKVCSHLYAAMQITSLSHLLWQDLHNMQRMHVWSLTSIPSYA